MGFSPVEGGKLLQKSAVLPMPMQVLLRHHSFAMACHKLDRFIDMDVDKTFKASHCLPWQNF